MGINKKQLAAEIQAEKSRIPIENMGFKDSAPPLISIIGPSDSGKTTLLKSILKKLWRKEKEFKGIVTLKIGRKRFSFYESLPTVENTIDTIKVSDLIIFVINLEIGIQKDTLEALTMMNSIGVPKFLFALTHYDKRKSNKQIDEVTKRLQKEFSFPIKHFCFEMKDREYHNIDKLVRNIEVMKYRPVEWKCTHPYVVIDGYSDGHAYGFLRGGPIGKKLNGHIPGIGDFEIEEIEVLKDPCPIDSKGNVFYNKNEDMGEESEETSSAEVLEFEEAEIKMFEGDCEMNCYKDEMNRGNDELKCDNNDISDSIDNDISNPIHEDELNSIDNDASNSNDKDELNCVNSDVDSDGNSHHLSNKLKLDHSDDSSSSDQNSSDFESLKELAKSKFLLKPETEEDLIEKFNEKFNSKEQRDLNILETLKKKESKALTDIQALEGLILPGQYLKLKINLSGSYDYSKLIVFGSFLPSENVPIFLKGQVLKNKWQKKPLVSNIPYLLSIGWHRIQTIPMFSSNGTLIPRCKVASEILFYSPSVPTGTSFFIFDPSSTYHILGTGKILETSGNYDVKRRVKLIGHPRTISGRNCIVQSMFSCREEAERFLNAKVETASGLRGLIKTAVGKDGSVRVAFEGTLLMSDIVILKCFLPVKPIEFYQNATPHSKLLKQPEEKSLNSRELGKDMESEDLENEGLMSRKSNVESNSEVLEDEGLMSRKSNVESNSEVLEDEFLKSRNSNNIRKIKNLESKLPYSMREIKEIDEKIDLPVPPEIRKIEQFKSKIEFKKRENELNEEMIRKKKIEKQKAKREETMNEKNEHKRKIAVKSHLEKKKHKKSKRKR